MKEALTFDDVALVPAYNNIPSRLEPDLSTWLAKDLRIDIPILAANMDTVIGEELAKVLISYGTYPIYHRFTDFEKQKEWVKKFEDKTFISAGLNDFDKVIQLLDLGAKGVCMDIAHGHDMRMLSFLNKLSDYLQKKGFDDRKIIAGNVCTAVGYVDLVNAGADAVKVGIGPGCLVGDTKILMSDGSYKSIKFIKPGDLVINREGNPVKVKKLIDKGQRKVIKLKHSKWHSPTYVTPDHLFYLGNLNKISNSSAIRNNSITNLSNLFDCLEWEEIGQVDVKNYVPLLPKKINYDLPESTEVDIGSYFGKRTKHTSFSKNRLDVLLGERSSSIPRNIKLDNYDIGYIFGTFIGDGSSIRSNKKRNPSGVGWFFGKDETEIAEKLNRSINKVFGLELSNLYDRKNMICIGTYNVFLAKFFEFFGKRSEKRLPKEFYCLNKKYLKGLLDGLIDSDGTTDKESGLFSFTNTSIEAVNLCMFCCNVLDINYCIYSHYPKDTGLNTLNIKNCKKLYILKQVNNKRNFDKNYRFSKFKDIVISNSLYRKVWDIEVDCSTHSFIADNVVVHNSACTTRQITGHGIGQFTAIQDCVEMAKKYSIPIISDGGIKNSGDIMKALSAGACSVMIGKMFALTEESDAKKRGGSTVEYSPNAVTGEPAARNVYNTREAKYRGQASEDFQKDFKGGLKKGTVAEGVDFWAPVTGTASQLLDNLLGGIRSGFTYGGARHIDELQRKAEFVKVISNSYAKESNPRKY